VEPVGTVGSASSLNHTQSSGTYRHRFDAPGTYAHRCTLHSGMKGRVVVSGS
jgi:plastocyanin